MKTDVYQLKPGFTYKVIVGFKDYDGIEHEVGETWRFEQTNYNAYHGGLTLHVNQQGNQRVYRFIDEPGPDVLIREFMKYVELVEENQPHQAG